MPVTAGSIEQTEQAARPYTGVVNIATDRGQGTGTLLYDGRAVLTAAHILEGSEPLTQASAQFTTPEGRFQQGFEKYSIHPNYDAGNNNYDLALL
jgi:V8-like Glu-specific endopeptidase